MPVYRAEHECGYVNQVFLDQDKSTIKLKCKRCGLDVAARQVRDKNAEFKSKNEVTGVFKHEGNKA